MRRVWAALLAALVVPAVHGLEELSYEVLRTDGPIEVRRYDAFVSVSTGVSAAVGFERAGNQAFRPLFRYIDGQNSQGRTIAMTAPVLQSPSSSGWDVAFVLPEAVASQDVPQPDDQTLGVVRREAHLAVAIRYSGTWREQRFRDHEQQVLEWVDEQGYTACGEPAWARYDPPFKPWFLRRNEVVVPIAVDGEGCDGSEGG